MLVVALNVALAGCSFNAEKSTCTNGSCTVTVVGKRHVEIDSQGVEFDVERIGGGAVTLAAGGQTATLREGQSGQVGPLQVTVTSVDGPKATLRINAA